MCLGCGKVAYSSAVILNLMSRGTTHVASRYRLGTVQMSRATQTRNFFSLEEEEAIRSRRASSYECMNNEVKGIYSEISVICGTFSFITLHELTWSE